MRALLFTLPLLIALVGAPPALAQAPEARVEMSASARRVETGAMVTLEVRADAVGGQVSNITLPSLDGFEVVARHVTQPMRFSFGRGQPLVRSTVIHQVSLRALRPGRFELSPAVATVDGERFESNALTLEVTGSAVVNPSGPGAVPPGAPPPAALPSTSGGIDGAVFDPEVFLRTVVDKRTPTIGEQVTVTIYLYTTVGGHPQLTREASTDGFWVHDLVDPNVPTQPDRQVVHGVPFRVYVLRRFAAFPLREGELTIGAPELRLQATPAFGFGRRVTNLDRRGVPVTLEVAPLPPPSPAGAVVGRFAMEAAIDRSEAKVGDAITLTVTIEGVGNLDNIRPPLPTIPGVRVLEPEIKDQTTTQADLVGGRRTIRYLLLPTEPGKVTIPSLSLPYFDPATDQYGETKTPSFEITVTGEPAGAPAATGPDAQAEETPDAAEGTRNLGTLRPRAELTRAQDPVSARPWFRWALAAPPLLWLLILLGRVVLARLRRRQGIPMAGGRLRAARARLTEADAHRKTGDAHHFYADVASALSAAAEARIGIVVAGLTRGELESALHIRGVPDDLTTRILQELEACDFARFSAAGADEDEMTRCAQRAHTLVDRLEALPDAPHGAGRP